MPIDSTPQPCPRCLRTTVLVSYPWGRQWLHAGTLRAECQSSLPTVPQRPAR